MRYVILIEIVIRLETYLLKRRERSCNPVKGIKTFHRILPVIEHFLRDRVCRQLVENLRLDSRLFRLGIVLDLRGDLVVPESERVDAVVEQEPLVVERAETSFLHLERV